MSVAEPTTRRWTRDEYHKVAALGVFADERVELIGGQIVTQSPQGSEHVAATDRVAEKLRDIFGAGFWVRMQFPLDLGQLSEPEPDIAVVRGRREDYTDHPTTALLIVEVSDTTLAYDCGAKASLYAAAGIDEYWIVNLNDRQLEVFREPVADPAMTFGHKYNSRTILKSGDTVSPLAAPRASLHVNELLQ